MRRAPAIVATHAQGLCPRARLDYETPGRRRQPQADSQLARRQALESIA
jgi:hypothetical protein